MDDFEQFLKSQPLRAVPAEWREQILSTAAASPTSETAGPWWRVWLWPSPYAWGALAAAWLVILGLNFTAQTRNNHTWSHDPALSDQQIYAMLEERRWFEEYLFAEAARTSVAPPPSKDKNPTGAALHPRESGTGQFA